MPSCFLTLATDVSELGSVVSLPPGACLHFSRITPDVFLHLRTSDSLRSGVGFLFVAVAALIGSPVAGALLTASGGNYVAPCCFGGACAMVGCALLTAARRCQVKRKGTW